MTRLLASLTLTALTLAASEAPKEKAKDTPTIPTQFRGDTGATGASLADTKWWDLLADEPLRQLIRQALTSNFDVRIAATRIAQAQASLGVTRSDQFPTISGTSNISRVRNPSNPVFPAFEANTTQLGLSAVWQLDFWGRYRKATEAARADLLASEWGRRAVTSTLVSTLATAYFTLRELDLELDLSRRTLAARKESLELNRTLERGGAVSLMDVHQAEILVEQAARTLPSLEKRIEQQENLISLLTGSSPGPIARGLKLTEQPIPPSVPAGLPSELLERRPDIKQAEARLAAARARVAVAKKAWFPQISLTGTAGFQAYSVTGLFDSKVYNIGASLTQPIFDYKRIRGTIKLTEAQREELILTYQQSIQTAFREVSDALIAVQKNREYRERQQALEQAARQATELSKVRYQGGASSYLEVLSSETTRFSAEVELAMAALDERLALIQLYTALGGGWQQ